MKIFLGLLMLIQLNFLAFSQVPKHRLKVKDTFVEEKLNSKHFADAYPWLSEDGLRIYYTKTHDQNGLWMAKRKNINSPFNKPEPIVIENLLNTSRIISAWLNTDESELFFIIKDWNQPYHNTLFRSKRFENEASFSNPIKVNLTQNGALPCKDIFISSPSLSSNLSELYLYFSGNDGFERTAYYKRVDDTTYMLQNFLMDAKNHCPGKLSSNNLSFYLTLRPDSAHLVKMTRKTLNDEFKTMEFIIFENESIRCKNFYQPHVNETLGIIASTYGHGSWESNDIRILKIKNKILEPEDAKNNADSFQVISKNVTINNSLIKKSIETTKIEGNARLVKNNSKPQIIIYPNPGKGLLNLEIKDNAESITDLFIINSTGIIIFKSNDIKLGSNYRIDLTEHPKGIYMCKVRFKNGKSQFKKFIINP